MQDIVKVKNICACLHTKTLEKKRSGMLKRILCEQPSFGTFYKLLNTI